MKKFNLTLALFMGTLFITNAQVIEPLKVDLNQGNLQTVEPTNVPNNNGNRRTTFGGWYNHREAYAGFKGLQITNNVIWLFPDTAKIMYSNEASKAAFAVCGSVFDPKDPVFFNFPAQFSRFNSFTYDSLSWIQYYMRQVDSIAEEYLTSPSITVDVNDFTQLLGDTLQIDEYYLVEGIDWNAEISNNQTAINLSIAINNIQDFGMQIFPSTVDGNRITIEFFLPVDHDSILVWSSDSLNLEPDGIYMSGGGQSYFVDVEVVDTVYIQYFTPESGNMSFGSYTIGGNTDRPYYYGVPRPATFSTATLLNSSAFKTDTILLTTEWKDSLRTDGTITGRALVTDVGGKLVPGSSNVIGNAIASTFTFKPMIPYTINDTIMSFNQNVNVAKKNNLYGIAFSFFTGVTDPHIENQEALNHSILTNYEVRYGQNLFNFLRGYIPGNIFGSLLVAGHQYHVTTQNLSVEDVNKLGYGLGNAYPNPTNGANYFTIPFALGQTSNATFTLSDITGKVVRTIHNKFDAGDNFIEIGTEGLNSGIYILNMTAGAYKGTRKIVVR